MSQCRGLFPRVETPSVLDAVKSDRYFAVDVRRIIGTTFGVGARMHSFQQRVESVLDRVRPLLQADGGDISLIEIIGTKACVRLTGKCAGCPSAALTLHLGVEMAIKEEVPEFSELIVC